MNLAASVAGSTSGAGDYNKRRERRKGELALLITNKLSICIFSSSYIL